MRRSSRIWLAAAALALVGCGGYTPIQTSFNKAAYLYSDGEYQAAVDEYRNAIADDDGDLRAHFNLGLALENLAAEKLEAEPEAAATLKALARARYEHVIAQHPFHAKATVNLAAMDWEAGNHEAANRALQALIDEDGDNLFACAALAANHLRQGGEEHLKAAEKALRVGLKEDSTNADLNALLGDVLLVSERWADADAAYATALKRDSDDIHALIGRGEVAFQGERWSDARSWMQQALYGRPRLWRAHRVLAEVAEKEDRLEEAVRHWWEARKLAGDAGGLFAEAPVGYSDRLLDLYERLKQRESERKQREDAGNPDGR